MYQQIHFLSKCAFILIALFFFVGCGQPIKHRPVKVDSIRQVNKSIELQFKKNSDSILFRVGYPEVKSFDPLNEAYSTYTEREKGYFRGKINLSEEDISHNLFLGIDSVACADCSHKVPLTDYLTQYAFYLMSATIENKNFKVIIYEELGQDGSHKYLSTINKNGQFISRIAIAGYYQQETYFDKNGERQAFFVELDGYVNKNLNINVTSDYQGIEKATYVIQSDGMIIKK